MPQEDIHHPETRSNKLATADENEGLVMIAAVTRKPGGAVHLTNASSGFMA
jgi:hypothetical protein